MNHNEVCQNCKFFKETPLDANNQGQCRQLPPKQFAIRSQQGLQIVSAYPNVGKSDFCGNFELELANTGLDN